MAQTHRSNRSSLLGNNGFQPIPELHPVRSRDPSPPHDATIDIPLHGVTTANNNNNRAANREISEKSGVFGGDGGGGPGGGTGGSPGSGGGMVMNGMAAGHGSLRHSHGHGSGSGGVHGHIRGGRRRKNGAGSDGSGSEDGLTAMGRLYDRVLNFSIVVRYFLYIIPVGAVISIPIIVGATDPAKIWGGVRIVWIFAWVLTVWVSLWASKLFAKALPSVFEFLCGIVSSGTRKYSSVIRSLELPLALSGWALASLATFEPIMTRNPDHPDFFEWEQVVEHILAAFLVSTLIFLAIKILIQLISISYHRMQYDTRIKESKDNVNVLCILYDASVALFPAYCPEFAEEDYAIHSAPEIVSRTQTGHIRSGSATPMRLLANVGRMGDKVTAAFGHIAQEVTGKEVFNPTSSHSIVVEALEKRKSCEALARRLWMSLVVEGKEALRQEDIDEVLCEHRKELAQEVFNTLDKDGNGDVSLDEAILTVCEIARERKAIASSLHDVDQAINVLDSLLCSLAFIVCVFVFVAFLNANFVTTLATAGTALLSLSFVFSATAAEVLGSCIFLFVKHPFDVGDRVRINSEELTVERISLLYTVFRNVATHRSTQAPNNILNSLWIDNISRSKAMREQLTIPVCFDTTLEDVQLLRREMQSFVSSKENSRDFEPDVEIEVAGIAEMSKLELLIEIKHKSNWSNEAVRASRRSKFMCALVLALRKVPIYGPGGGGAALGSADQPSYSVAVSREEAEAARQTFDETREAKRLRPSKGASQQQQPQSKPNQVYAGLSTGATMTAQDDDAATPTLRNRSNSGFGALAEKNETNAMTALNSRSPLADPAHDVAPVTTTTTMMATSRMRKPSTGARISSGSASQEAESELEEQRSRELDEVYDVLRRQNTRGRRRESASASSQQDNNTTTASPILGGTSSVQNSPSLGRRTGPSEHQQPGGGNGNMTTYVQDYGLPPSSVTRGGDRSFYNNNYSSSNNNNNSNNNATTTTTANQSNTSRTSSFGATVVRPSQQQMRDKAATAIAASSASGPSPSSSTGAPPPRPSRSPAPPSQGTADETTDLSGFGGTYKPYVSPVPRYDYPPPPPPPPPPRSDSLEGRSGGADSSLTPAPLSAASSVKKRTQQQQQQQQQQLQQQQQVSSSSPQQLSPTSPLAPPAAHTWHAGPTAGSSRPGSSRGRNNYGGAFGAAELDA